ncbi:hypothetical protein S40293_03517 [Stachybotrys chartarum IBT 40293]|nr:hypothetical protein S40293_03517 [Stachybotrys chartarum IBT 40293]
MAGFSGKKRSNEGNAARAPKKQKRKQAYHSASEEEGDFDAVNLLDSDDDIHEATVDHMAGADSSSDSAGSDNEAPSPKKRISENPSRSKVNQDNADTDEDEDEEDDDSAIEGEEIELEPTAKRSKSKRNDPAAFATSLSKILSTKLSSSKRADPVLARSADAHEASKMALDNVLEAKAKKHLREQKRKALEKGRVKDVLIATKNEVTGEAVTTTAEILDTERRLRKVAQRGVVKLFNAVRAAQVKAVETEKGTRKDGVVGITRREEKVNEMSKKGFLELIASGGGGLKKGALEEA